ncbi:hypothetical protein Tsubulata_024673 [Turnera subulata]|uniref:Uncharacterized protein n=1 Tax=Turnera subulata TaxID=218843 RepID=A0A9Q0JK67_9ROSI|nr:hypothetical protein Tsubulata_024673 [Turnera subulata]
MAKIVFACAFSLVLLLSIPSGLKAEGELENYAVQSESADAPTMMMSETKSADEMLSETEPAVMMMSASKPAGWTMSESEPEANVAVDSNEKPSAEWMDWFMQVTGGVSDPDSLSPASAPSDAETKLIFEIENSASEIAKSIAGTPMASMANTVGREIMGSPMMSPSGVVQAVETKATGWISWAKHMIGWDSSPAPAAAPQAQVGVAEAPASTRRALRNI